MISNNSNLKICMGCNFSKHLQLFMVITIILWIILTRSIAARSCRLSACWCQPFLCPQTVRGPASRLAEQTEANAELCSALWWRQICSTLFYLSFYSAAQLLGSPKLGASMDNCALSLFQKGLPVARLQFLFLLAPLGWLGPCQIPLGEKKMWKREMGLRIFRVLSVQSAFCFAHTI